MKAKEYMTPEMEVVMISYQASLLAGSGIDENTEGGDGGGNADNPHTW